MKIRITDITWSLGPEYLKESGGSYELAVKSYGLPAMTEIELDKSFQDTEEEWQDVETFCDDYLSHRYLFGTSGFRIEITDTGEREDD